MLYLLKPRELNVRSQGRPRPLTCTHVVVVIINPTLVNTMPPGICPSSNKLCMRQQACTIANMPRVYETGELHMMTNHSSNILDVIILTDRQTERQTQVSCTRWTDADLGSRADVTLSRFTQFTWLPVCLNTPTHSHTLHHQGGYHQTNVKADIKVRFSTGKEVCSVWVKISETKISMSRAELFFTR